MYLEIAYLEVYYYLVECQNPRKIVSHEVSAIKEINHVSLGLKYIITKLIFAADSIAAQIEL